MLKSSIQVESEDWYQVLELSQKIDIETQLNDQFKQSVDWITSYEQFVNWITSCKWFMNWVTSCEQTENWIASFEWIKNKIEEKLLC